MDMNFLEPKAVRRIPSTRITGWKNILPHLRSLMWWRASAFVDHVGVTPMHEGHHDRDRDRGPVASR